MLMADGGRAGVRDAGAAHLDVRRVRHHGNLISQSALIRWFYKVTHPQNGQLVVYYY